MNENEYDLIVIGSGPAGQKGAIAAAKLGKKVVIVDRKEQDGRARVEAHGLRLLSLLTIDDFHVRPGPDGAR